MRAGSRSREGGRRRGVAARRSALLASIGALVAPVSLGAQGVETAAMDFQQTIQDTVAIPLDVGAALVQLDVTRWGDPPPDAADTVQVFVLSVVRQPAFLSNVEWTDDVRLSFSPGDTRKTVGLRFDVAPPGEAAGAPEDLVLAIVPEDTVVVPDRRELVLRLRPPAAAALRACVPTDDVDPDVMQFAAGRWKCDGGDILVYDEVQVYFTPGRDLSKPFRWRIVHLASDEQVDGGVWDPDSDDLTENTPRAEEDAPGLFVSRPRLWSRPPGTYALQSCEPELSDQLFGQGGHGGCGDEWREVGSFEVDTRRLHFQRFTVATGSASLAAGGSWRIRAEPGGGGSVAVGATAVTADGEPVALGRVLMDFPETIDPQAAEAGRIEAELEAPQWDLGATLFELLPTGAAAPDARLVTSDLLSHGVPSHERTAWGLRLTRYDDAIGQPPRPFSEYIHESGTSWYIPVRLSVNGGGPLYGFAVYGSQPVDLAASDPDGADESIAVPSVAGLPAADAVARIEAAGLVASVTVAGPAPSEGAAHTVSDQRPAPGTRLAARESVEVDLYGAYEPDDGADIRVGDVSGLSAAEAKRRLEAQGLVPEFVVATDAPTAAAAHTAASQEPSAGAAVARGTAVTVTLHGPFVQATDAAGGDDADPCERLLAAAYLAYTEERWEASIEAYDRARDAGCGERATTGLADAERRRTETEALDRRWEEEQQREAAAEAERQRQASAAAEAERQRQAAAAAAEAERQRQAAAAAEAERQRQAAAAAEAERQRQAAAAAEAERQRQADEERERRETEEAVRRVQEDFARACGSINAANSAFNAGQLPEALQLYRQAWDAGCGIPEVGDRITWIQNELDRQADAWTREQNRRQQCSIMLDQLRQAIGAGQNVQAAILSFGAALGQCQGPELDEILSGAGGGPPPPQELDDVVVSSATVQITVWDHQSEDGDFVTIWVNGYVLLSEYRLTNRQRSFQVQLDPYRANEIRILAHNEGSSSPNTAALTVSPAAQGGRQTWNLKTGQVAIARVFVR